MTPQQVKASICALFESREEDGVLLVKTPISNLSNDNIVAYISQEDNSGKWRVDDNGETSFSLDLAGVDTATDAFNSFVKTAISDCDVEWDDEELHLLVEASEVGMAVLLLANVSSRISLLATSKPERSKSKFKETMLQLLDDISKQTGRAAEFDVPVAGNLLKADCRFDTSIPTFVIVATSDVRLMEAELIHSQLQILKQPGYVVAVVENVKQVGKSQFSRANYLTDKALEYEEDLFSAFLRAKLEDPALANPSVPTMQ